MEKQSSRLVIENTSSAYKPRGLPFATIFGMKCLIISLLFVTELYSQSTIRLGDIRKVYIEQMSNGLDQYLRAAISKKFHSRLEIVLDRAQADAILASPDTSAQKTQSATVDLTDASGQVVLWSGAAGDRSAKWLDLKHGGEQKLADHLIDQLKKAMEH
jgi:hypothetical protein